MSLDDDYDFASTPPTALGDWVVLAPISPQAKVLYWVMSAHMCARGYDGIPDPTRNVLAELLGCTDTREIDPLFAELVTIDAVSVQGGIYRVHQTPPKGVAGPRSLHDFYAARVDE